MGGKREGESGEWDRGVYLVPDVGILSSGIISLGGGSLSGVVSSGGTCSLDGRLSLGGGQEITANRAGSTLQVLQRSGLSLKARKT